MNATILHESRGRIRLKLRQKRMTLAQADLLEAWLQAKPWTRQVSVHERTCCVILYYSGSRQTVLDELRRFSWSDAKLSPTLSAHSTRALNREFEEKLVSKVLCKAASALFLPPPVRIVRVLWHMIPFVKRGLLCILHRTIKVDLLDAFSISISVCRRDFGTAGMVMFLLEIGELLEEWTRKKSVEDLARCMSLNVDRVWVRTPQGEILVPISQVQQGDAVIVRAGGIIPADGSILEGECTVNQSSLTGESIPVPKHPGSMVYAGTVLEEGELEILVKAVSGSTRFEKIVTMIEDSEKLKSALESKAEHLADKLVPYTLLGTGIVGLVTRNVTKALSVLMVDFSCALKLAMPIAVLSAIREAGQHGITVKGGKYLEAVAEADTIVFDKTGTLTKAKPTVKEIVVFGDCPEDEALRIAACLEEHFPHSMAKAVVDAAKKRKLYHEEMHSKVEYIVAHGISSYIEEKKVVIGSSHFVFEDEGCRIRPKMQERFDALPSEYSHLYLAIDGELTAVICIEDPLREEAEDMVRMLKEEGLKKVVMMTGDSERTAASIARRVGVDEYYSEVLPEDKARFVEKEKEAGRKVIMIGDGINDSPALSAADAGIAISDGAEIAREIADITIAADDLRVIVTLKKLANAMMKRIQCNYRGIVGINSGLIALGVGGVIQPTTSALLHNTSTLAISLRSMQDLLPEEEI